MFIQYLFFLINKPINHIQHIFYYHYMQYRFLGPTGIKVSVISYGNWLNSNSADSQKITTDCVKQAWDLGINFFDTAESYGYGEAERQIGVALHSLNVPRHHFVLTTKIYFSKKVDTPNSKGLSRKHVIEGLRNSLKRLTFDYVDVVYCHRPDPETPMQEICRAYDWVIRKGWAFYWGTSQWNQDQIAQAHYVCDKYNLIKPVVQQPQYNIYNREKLEIGYKKLFEKKLLGTTIWSPLSGGVLTGKYNDGIPEGTRYDKNPELLRIYNLYFSEDKKDKTITALHKFKALAEELEVSQAQLAMAWCIANPDVSTAITGASRPEQIVDTVNALKVLPKLTKEVLQRIEEIFGTEPTGKRNMKNFEPEKSRRREILQY